MGSTGMLTSHRCTQPEIDLVGPGEATGTWALEDVVIHQDFGVTIHGASFYEDRYVKVDGDWRIAPRATSAPTRSSGPARRSRA